MRWRMIQCHAKGSTAFSPCSIARVWPTPSQYMTAGGARSSIRTIRI
jgi:hypothetical protein